MKKRKSAPTPEPTPAPVPEPEAPKPIPFNIPPEMLQGLKSGVEAFGNDPMFCEVMPWGLAGFAIGALSGLVVFAKKYSVTRAVEELDHYVVELEAEAKDRKVARSDRESAATQIRLLKELRERFVALEPKPTPEPVKIEIKQREQATQEQPPMWKPAEPKNAKKQKKPKPKKARR